MMFHVGYLGYEPDSAHLQSRLHRPREAADCRLLAEWILNPKTSIPAWTPQGNLFKMKTQKRGGENMSSETSSKNAKNIFDNIPGFS